MPFATVVVVAAAALSYVRGGRFHRVAEARLAHPWLLFAGLGLQAAVDLGASGGDVPATPLLVLSLGLVAAWVVLNRYRPGMPLILLGLLLNTAVITANGAMPVSPEALAATGYHGGEIVPGKHESLTAATRLKVLADIIPLPRLRTVISVGDVVLAAGLLSLTHHLMSFRPAVERRGGLRSEAEGDEDRSGAAVGVSEPR